MQSPDRMIPAHGCCGWSVMPLPRSAAYPCSSNAQPRRQTDRRTRGSGRPTACASQRAWEHFKATQYRAVLEQPASLVQVRLCGPSFAILRIGLQAPAVSQLAGVIAPAASCLAAYARAQCPGFYLPCAGVPYTRTAAVGSACRRYAVEPRCWAGTGSPGASSRS